MSSSLPSLPTLNSLLAPPPPPVPQSPLLSEPESTELLEICTPPDLSLELAKEFVLHLRATLVNTNITNENSYISPHDKLTFDVHFLRSNFQPITLSDMSKFMPITPNDVLLFTDLNRVVHRIPLLRYQVDANNQSMPYLLRFCYTVPEIFVPLHKFLVLFQFRKALASLELTVKRVPSRVVLGHNSL